MSGVNTKSAEMPYLIERSPGYFEYQLPISVKAVVSIGGKVPLLKNERDEWELPGGKLELGERPEICVGREIEEELSIEVSVEECIYSWVYEIFPYRHVFVVVYLARATSERAPVFSHEHKELALLDPSEVLGLNMPDEYKRAISLAMGRGLFE